MARRTYMCACPHLSQSAMLSLYEDRVTQRCMTWEVFDGIALIIIEHDGLLTSGDSWGRDT